MDNSPFLKLAGYKVWFWEVTLMVCAVAEKWLVPVGTGVLAEKRRYGKVPHFVARARIKSWLAGSGRL